MSIKCCFNPKHNLTSYYSDDYNSATRKLIPLKHIDKLNTSISNMKRITVSIDNSNGQLKLKSLFKLEGEFPTYISSIQNNEEIIRLNLDIQIGDCIIMVNNFNVCRASTKSVKKLIEKSKKSLKLTLMRPKSNNCKVKSNIYDSRQLSNYVDVDDLKRDHYDLTTDYGYFSIPATDSERNTLTSKINSTDKNENGCDDENDDLFQSLSYTTSSSISDFTDSFLSSNKKKDNHDKNNDLIKYKIEDFLYELQDAIQTYVRPCIVLKILSIQQCLDLYQNVEKLIPVSKFMLNIIGSLDQISLPNAESVNIVFESYKTYLDGLPKAICLLSELTKNNKMFISFLNEIKDSSKIFDLLFLPLKFVQIIIEYMQSLFIDFKRKNYSKTSDEAKLKELVNDLYQSSTKAHSIIRHKFESNLFSDDSDLSSVSSVTSDYFNSSYFSDESSISYKIDNLPILIQNCSNELENINWEYGSIAISKNEFRIKLNDDKFIESRNIVHIKKSSNSNVIYFKLIEQQDLEYNDIETIRYKIKLDNSKLKDYLFEVMCKIFQKSS